MQEPIEIDYSQVQRYEDFLSQLPIPHIRQCVKKLEDLESKVSHLPRVTTVASLVGHCAYDGKLKQLIGVRQVVSSSYPGKGLFVHKLLALASIEVFGNNQVPQNVEKFFHDLADELTGGQNYPQYSSNKNENQKNQYENEIKTAIELFVSLLRVKPLLFSIVGLHQDDVRPVVEQQIFDYDVHMLGVPDLVLEDMRSKKAIVVEWKTYAQDGDLSVSGYEKAQVVAYAMLEARRLGYEIYTSGNNDVQLLDAISGKLTDNGIKDIRVLPAIIRPQLLQNPRLKILPHPVFSSSKDVASAYKTFRALMGEILVAARYLTYLVTSFYTYGYDKKTSFEECNPEGSDRPAFLQLPPRPIPRGNPYDQNNSSLCRSCSLKEECQFYFGTYHLDEFERMAWTLRFAALAKKEKTLWNFRAIYELSRRYSRENLISLLKKGRAFEWSGDVKDNSMSGQKNVVRITINPKDSTSFKIDVLDELWYDDESGSFVGVRELRPFERRLPFVLDERTPVVIYANDGSSTIPSSINMTGSIIDVEFVNDGKRAQVVYRIDIPSPALQFQKQIFAKYSKIYPEMFKNVIIAQIGVDLTHIDLITLDAFHRIIGKKLREKLGSQDSDDLRKMLMKLDEEFYRWAFEAANEPEISDSILHYISGGIKENTGEEGE